MAGLRILLLSAYDAASHKAWRLGLVNAFPEYEWHVSVMQPRHFSWRIRGNGLHFAFSDNYHGVQYNLIIATSMVDLATLRGLRPDLAVIPTLLYFHENQLAYPLTDRTYSSVEPAMVNIYSALAADKLCFNSRYNRDSFLDGVSTLLSRFPDYVPTGIVDRLETKSHVAAVPLLDDAFQAQNKRKTVNHSVNIVWNHRWEYDKGPERLLALIYALPATLSLRVHIVGQRFTKYPEVMNEVRNTLDMRGWLGNWGPIDTRERYLALLRECDIVISTALHDFQGLSILEAMACGCLPVVPDRLAYREYIPSHFRYSSLPSSKKEAIESEAVSASVLICHVIEGGFEPHDIGHLSWPSMKSAYQALFSFEPVDSSVC